MTRLFYLVIGFSLLLGPMYSCNVAHPEPLHVMTFNIRYDGNEPDGASWENRKRLVAQLLDSLSADIVGLQEVEFNQLQFIQTNLKEYGCIGLGRAISEDEFRGVRFDAPKCLNFNGNDDGEYSLILYNKERIEILQWGMFWFSPTPDKPSRLLDAHFNRVCTWGRFKEKISRKEFYAYNLHLEHGDREDVRKESVRILARHIAEREPQLPVVLTGDFNATESDDFVIPWLLGEEQGTEVLLIDTWRYIHPTQSASEGTFHNWQGSLDGPRIDYVFVTQDCVVNNAKVVQLTKNGIHPSDHHPVWASITIK